MSYLRKIWIAFVNANGLEVSVDFGKQRKIYSGLGREDGSEESFRETVEFQGFLDGYERNPHKYRGPRDSLEQDAAEFIEDVLSGVDDKIKRLVSSIADGDEGVQADLRRIADEIGNNSPKA